MKLLLLILPVAAFMAVTGCATQPAIHGVPNLAQVSPGVYRGGEPTAEGWAYLHSVGVSNVVELNLANDTQPGFEFHRFPISIWRQVFVPPSLHEISRAVDCIEPGTFVHCSHGQDRTGLVIAEYRVWRDGRSMTEARSEMLEHGFHRSLFALDYFWNHRRWYERRANDYENE